MVRCIIIEEFFLMLYSMIGFLNFVVILWIIWIDLVLSFFKWFNLYFFFIFMIIFLFIFYLCLFIWGNIIFSNWLIDFLSDNMEVLSDKVGCLGVLKGVDILVKFFIFFWWVLVYNFFMFCFLYLVSGVLINIFRKLFGLIMWVVILWILLLGLMKVVIVIMFVLIKSFEILVIWCMFFIWLVLEKFRLLLMFVWMLFLFKIWYNNLCLCSLCFKVMVMVFLFDLFNLVN